MPSSLADLNPLQFTLAYYLSTDGVGAVCMLPSVMVVWIRNASELCSLITLLIQTADLSTQ
jgi:hypothetical protein